MATISRGLDPLISVYNQQSFEFETMSLNPIVRVNCSQTGVSNLDFIPVLMSSFGGLREYIFDITSILPYLIGLQPQSISSFLSAIASFEVIPSSEVIEDHATIETQICFAKDKIGESKVNLLRTYGRNQKIYSYGYVWLFLESTEGNYIGTMDGVTYVYHLTHGYNKIQLALVHQKTGVLTFGYASISLDIVWLGVSTLDSKIEWINSDGCWSTIHMNKRTTKTDVSNKKTVPNYTKTHSESKGKNIEISASEKTTCLFDVVAKDTDHYNHLVSMSSSRSIIYTDSNNVERIAQIKDISDTVAECRQNLKFSLTLEWEEDAASY